VAHHHTRTLLTITSSLLRLCRTQTCRFSGLKIYPGRGILFIRVDGQQFLFLRKKCKSLFNQRKRPAKIAWTTLYRKQHRKDQEQQVARKKRRSANKGTRAVAGASLEVITKKRAEKPEARKASREAALREIKERAKKAKADKAADKAAARAAGKAIKNVPRGAGKAGAKSTGR
jgi:large subunit ribosomal protein L24e